MSTELPEPHRDRRGHDFWPPASVLEAIPALYATEHREPADKVVHLHYFAGNADWWVVEIDSIEQPRLAFGFAHLHGVGEAELTYMNLQYLAEIFEPGVFVAEVGEGGGGRGFAFTRALVIERDLGWTPRPAGEVIPGLW